MEEVFWKIWYGEHEILFAYSCISTGFALAPPLHSLFFEKWITMKQMYSYMMFIVLASLSCMTLYINYVNPAARHYNNALRFMNGEGGFSIDLNMAMAAFEKAGEKGHVQAYRYLGEILMNRREDYAAVKAWEKAVKLGDPRSACLLGEFYEKTLVELPEARKKELAYISYYTGGCLGDESLRNRAEKLRSEISPQAQDDAVQFCVDLKSGRK